MTNLTANLEPKFFKGEKENPFTDDLTRGYFWQMEKDYITDGKIDSNALAIGMNAMTSDEPGSESFEKAKEICRDSGSSIERIAFVLFMAASYHDYDDIDWSLYFQD